VCKIQYRLGKSIFTLFNSFFVIVPFRSQSGDEKWECPPKIGSCFLDSWVVKRCSGAAYKTISSWRSGTWWQRDKTKHGWYKLCKVQVSLVIRGKYVPSLWDLGWNSQNFLSKFVRFFVTFRCSFCSRYH